MSINKTDLTNSLAQNKGYKKYAIKNAMDDIFAEIANALSRGEKVVIRGFGTFEVKTRGERKGRNPKSGEEIVIPASKHPSFTAGKAFKDAVN